MKKQQFICPIHKGAVSLFLFLSFIAASLTSWSQTSKVQVFHIQNYFSEAYLVKGSNEKLVLIETGVPVAGYQDSLVNAIKSFGFRPEDITLAIVTHGHGDHAGNARFLQQTFQIPIAGGKADLDKFTSGKTDLSKSEDVSIWGNRLRPYSDLSYQPFTPDVIVDQSAVDLAKYGVAGKIIPLKGGHTPGDLLVLIGENLFVGDAFVGTFIAQGGGLAPDGHHVREHFFHENKQLADQNLGVIAGIAAANKVTTIYPTHNGPVSTQELTKYINEEPLLRILSQQETDILSDVVKGKSDFPNKYLSPDFMLQSANNKQYTKQAFIEAYITHPPTPVESLAAEDFRIVRSDKNTAVLTYLETIKLEGKAPQTVFVTEKYARSGKSWLLTHKQAVSKP